MQVLYSDAIVYSSQYLYGFTGECEYIMTDIQYVYDAAGHKQGVIVPIELWEKTLGQREPPVKPCNPQEYYGMYREVFKDPEAEALALRAEWNRV